MLSATIVKRPPTAEKIIKQSLYGVSRGINETATEARTAVIGATKQHFIIRTPWLDRGPFTPKIDRSDIRQNNLTTRIRWAADWMFLHQTGGTKVAKSGRLAVPTDEVKRTKRLIIPRSQRPKALRLKGSFVIKTSHGDVIAIRQGRGKKKPLKFLYNLEGSVRIKKEPTFFPVIEKVVKRRLNKNVAANITKALRNIK
jgi:hypothetical protein